MRPLSPIARFVLLLLVALPGAGFLPIPEAGAEEDLRRIGRIPVKEEGFLRVRPEVLRRLGAHSAPRVSVTRLGRPVATIPSASGLVFLAQGHRTNTSAFGVYELWLHDGEAPRTTPDATALEAEAEGKPPVARRTLAVDKVHGPLAAARAEVYDHEHAPTWFLTRIPPGRSAATDLDPAGAAQGADQTLTAHVWATRIGAVAIKARWGERDLGVASGPTAAGGADFRWRVPADAVPAEGTALLLEDVSPKPPAPESQDISDHRGTLWVDALSLEGEVEPTIGGPLRRFALVDGDAIELRPAAAATAGSVHVAAVDPDGRPAASGWRWGHVADGRIRVKTLDLPAGSQVFVSTHARDVEPEPARERADPLALAAGMNHVILAVPELIDAATTLSRHRWGHGIRSAVVPVPDVYDAYGYGEPSSAALRAFLVDRMKREDVPLDYVVLAGDATLDRTDMAPFTTIPVPMARTKYNGATAADRLYALPPSGAATGGAEIGRLPFREARPFEAYVERLIAYEKHPPADPTRRLLRFLTNESRFGAFVDRLLETMFSTIVTHHIPPAYDIEITFASKLSPYLWPPLEMNDHVIEGFNDGCLFLTYVGHGFGRGFDQLRIGDKHFPVLHVDHANRIACTGTPPIVFTIACTTAIYDHPGYEGVGETLLARPEGPIAYWGATRICHPAANTLLGRAITKYVAKREGDWRLGDILGRARDEVLEPPESDAMRGMINVAIGALAKGADPERLALEGSWMYTLLGDPALKVAFPKTTIEVEAEITDGGEVKVTLEAPFEDGTPIHVSLEAPRNDPWHKPEAVKDPLDPAEAERIRENHRRVNNLKHVLVTVMLNEGRATLTMPLPEGIHDRLASRRRVAVKAWTIAQDDVHQGGVMLNVPDPEPEPKPDPEK